MKTLSYSKVKYTSRVSLILMTVEKIEHENFDFVLFLLSFFLSFFLSSFPSRITQKVYGVYERSGHHKTALLPEIILFLVIVACELRLVSYGLINHTSLTLFYMQFCAYLHAQLEN